MLRSLRNAFITGLIFLLPLGITLFLVKLLVDTVGAPASKLFFFNSPQLVPTNGLILFVINFVATLFVLVFIALIGYISRYFLGKFILRVTEKIIARLPFISVLYNTSKQIVGTFSDGKRAVFRTAVLVEFPSKGARAIGFITGDVEGELRDRCGKDKLSVFVPTTPNPTSGFLIFVDKSGCEPLHMSIGDAMKVIISGGAVIPARSNESLTNNQQK
jgi:uncharacterized membrane protein